MRRFTLTAALLIAGFAGAAFAHGAAAQGIAPNGVVFGQGWNLPQDFSTLERMQAAQGSGTAAERAARAARQAQFNRNFPGTPIRRTSASR
ncbi:hypothetical protein [Sediminicoccus sp. KRV36]|uniref:hypothetical protein n=1 Tax=Sediminicoccus sp. KRV36 TaxID=3133721 RepID=UPI00200BD4A9|nr:hypothetical protein [Sediminicoccus rosea]UPY36783.1 hypothetical protein LHU95_21600 [Sediminicoccus rosea]